MADEDVNNGNLFNDVTYTWNTAEKDTEHYAELGGMVDNLRSEVQRGDRSLLPSYISYLRTLYGVLKPLMMADKIPDKVKDAKLSLFQSGLFKYWEHYDKMFIVVDLLMDYYYGEIDKGFCGDAFFNEVLNVLGKIRDSLELLKQNRIGIPHHKKSGDPMKNIKSKFKSYGGGEDASSDS